MALRGLRRWLDKRESSGEGVEEPSTSDSTDGEATDPESLGEMSAEGAEGTSTTLDDSGSQAESYEPPSWVESRIQEFRPDLDADDDGKLDALEDSDGDGLDDYSERWVHGTNPYKKDSDGDGIDDGSEVMWEYDPADADMDDDDLKDGFEVKHGTDPTQANTDGKGPDDGQEDADDDGLTAVEEQARGTSPNMSYTDRIHHDRTGKTLADVEGELGEDRAVLIEEEAARAAAATPRYVIVEEGDAEYEFETSRFGAKFKSGAGTAHVTDKATGDSVPITNIPRGSVIRVMNRDDVVELKAQLDKIEDGREELPPDSRGAFERAWDYKNSRIDDPAKTGHAGSSEAEGEPDASGGEPENDPWDRDGVDPDSLTFDVEAPEVPGSETDPNAMLAGESRLDSGLGRGAVGSDPGGPGGAPPPAEDINPVGKAVDPNDLADMRRGGNAGTGGPADTSGPAGTSRIGQNDPSASGAASGIDDLLNGDIPAGDSDFGSGSSGGASKGGDGSDEGGWVEGRVEGLDDEMTMSGGDSDDEWQTFEPGSDSDGESYHRGEDGGWYDSNDNPADTETSAMLDQAESDAAASGDSEAAGGDSESSEGGDGDGDSPNFGGGMDLDRAALLDGLGRSSGGGSTGTEMKASPGPVESGRPAGTAPIVHAAAPSSPTFEDPEKDSDGDGVSDAQEHSDGTSPDDAYDYLDSDGDGVADHVERDEGTDPDDADDYLVDGEPPPEEAEKETSSPGDEEDKHGQDDYEGSGGSEGLSTSVNPIDGGFVDRDDAEKALSGVGAPQNAAQPQPIDPQRWDGAAVEGRDLRGLVTADDLAQPVPDEGQGGEHLRENTGVDAGASSGMFGTGAIDPAETEVQTDGPWQDTPSTPDLDAAHDESESTDPAELEQVELGIALETEGGSEPMKLVTTGPNDTPLRPEDPPERSDTDAVSPDDFETMDTSSDMDLDKALALGLVPEPEPPIELEPDLLKARQGADLGDEVADDTDFDIG